MRKRSSILLVWSFIGVIAFGQDSGSLNIDRYRTSDRILKDAVTRADQVIRSLAGEQWAKNIKFYVLESAKPKLPEIPNEYRTDSCKALTTQGTVVCNATFFLEIEAAIRSFLLDEQLLSSDENLFDLARRIQNDLPGYLQQLRSRPIPGMSLADTDKQIVTQLKLMMLYFFAHELAHIKGKEEGHEFARLTSPDAPLDAKVTEAVIKFARHVEAFNKMGFDLPGFEEVSDPKGRIRAAEVQHKKKNAVLYQNYDTFFNAEAYADQYASSIMVKYLNLLASRNPMQAEEEQNFLIASLFFNGIYFWYKDFYNFSTKACNIPIKDSQQFVICMMMDRMKYVQAASLFQETHEFLLLRSLLAIEDIIKQRVGFFSVKRDTQTIWVSKEELDSLPKDQMAKTIWRASNLQKYYLLCILMDTPVKLANVGSATGWLMEIDKIRISPQLLVMNFETITQATKRLLEFR